MNTYSVIMRKESGQPDYPWGMIRHTTDSDLYYLDGTEVRDGVRNLKPDCWKKVAGNSGLEDWVNNHHVPHKTLTNLTREQMMLELIKLEDRWELKFMATYVSDVLLYEVANEIYDKTKGDA